MLFLVTAGNTREPIDDVRDWGNIFTGNTGLSIARALTSLGRVHLLTSNRTHIQQIKAENSPTLSATPFTSHRELRDALEANMKTHRYDGIFMTAAVSDYSPQRTYSIMSRQTLPDGREQWIVQDAQKPKISSRHNAIAVLGTPTEKLVDLFRSPWGHQGLLVKFKLQVGIDRDELLTIGRASRLASGADYLVANTLDMVQGGQPGAYLIGPEGDRWVPREELATTLAKIASTHRT